MKKKQDYYTALIDKDVVTAFPGFTVYENVFADVQLIC